GAGGSAGAAEQRPARPQRRARGRGRRPQVRRGGDRGARARRAGHDPARRDLLPRGRPRRAPGAGERSRRRRRDAMTWAVVAAAGRGSRFGGDVPKQYLEVAGDPLVAHSLRALFAHPGVQGAVVVLAPDDTRWRGWGDGSGCPVIACTGGATRAESVLAGLAALPDEVRADAFVLVHDAARPNLRPADLAALLERGRADPVGAILATPVRDTLKRAGDDGGIDRTEPRERLWRAQTPQLFRRLQLRRALE